MLSLLANKSKFVASAAMLLAVIVVAWWSPPVYGQSAAFPGAAGFGVSTTGARGATPAIYRVTNLNDSGAGSFRDAVSHSGRIIVFDVGGNIQIASPVSASDNLTILGQTAPGDGIAIYGAEVSFYGRSNVICRYVRFRDTTQDPGGTGTGNSSGNCVNLGSTTNMIFDHVSCEFASYNNIDAVSAGNLTFQNSLVAAPIASQRFNFHWEGGGDGTFLNNIFVDGHNRSILAKGDCQFVNNTVYNYQAGFTSGNSSGAFNYDVIGNYFITGPSTTSSSNDIYQVDSNQSAYATGNLRDSNNDGTLNGGSQNTIDSAVVLNSRFFGSTPNLPQLSAAAAYAWNIAHAGASLKHDTATFASSLGYDQVDQYMINEVKTLGTAGRLWSSETQDGLGNSGLGVVNSGAKPSDADGDGIPDAYEAAHGMNSNSAGDALYRDPLGYTMIEHYANEMADQATLTTCVWSASSGAWTTAANWSGSATPITYDIASLQGKGTTNGLVTVSTSTAAAYQFYIGGNGPAAGEKVQVTSGKLDVLDTIFVGNTNNGTLQIDGGIVQAGNVIIGKSVSGTTYNGSLLLNGGTLQVFNAIVQGGGTPNNWTSGGSITWNGGTIQALGAVTVSAPATLATGGGKCDTNGNSATFSGVIGGSGSLAKLGNGTLTLEATNTYSGATTISGGILEIGSVTNGGVAGNLGAAGNASENVVLDGGTLQVDNGSSTDRGMTITANGGMLDDADVSGGVTISGAIVPSGSGNRVFTFDKAGGGTNTGWITGAISDSNSAALAVLKIDSGRLAFSGTAKTYSGDTMINAGTLMAYATNVMPYGGGKGNVIVASGATFDARFSENINGLSGAGTVTSNGSANTLTLGNGSATATFSGMVTGPLNITKVGSGTQTFSSSNTYSGATAINAGTLVNDLGGSSGTTGTVTPFGSGLITVGSGAVLQLGHNPGSHNNSEFDYANNLTLNAGTLYEEDGIQHLKGMLNVGVTGGTLGATYNIGATDGSKGLYLDGAVSGSGNLTLRHTGINTGNNYDTSFVVFVNNTNSYSGTITVVPMGTGNGGGSYLGVNASNGLSVATVNLSGNNTSNAAVFGSSPLVFNTGLGTVTLGGLAGSGNIVLKGYNETSHVYGTDAIALSVGNNNANTTYSGSVSGTGSLTKVGSGTMVLAGNNSAMSGAVTVQSGVLRVTNSSALGTGPVYATNTTGTALTSLWLDSPSGFTIYNNIVTTGMGGGANNTTESGVIRNISGNNTVRGLIALTSGGGDTAIKANAGKLTLSGTVSNNIAGTRTLALGGAAEIDISGRIVNGSGTIAIRKVDSGNLVLSGSNTYTGGTMVDAGRLTLASNAAIRDGTSLMLGAGTSLVLDASAAGAPIVTAPGEVPEPSTMELLAAGTALGGWNFWRWKKAERRYCQ